MSNAAHAQTISSTNVTLFQSTADGGSDIDGATAITIINTGSADALIWCKGHHGNTVNPQGLLPAGKSITYTVADINNVIMLQKLVAVRAASSDTTLSWQVTSRR